jgi:hypothetical protein
LLTVSSIAGNLRPVSGTKQSTSFSFSLVWTVGFSGKRFLPDEAKAAQAIENALALLHEAARKQAATLMAISSLARGGDVLFARACTHATADRPALPWKCLLPFAWEPFQQYDLALDDTETPLPRTERQQREAEAAACRKASFETPEIACPRADPSDREERIAAYLECGYRTVDEADVMIVLLRGDEFAAVRGWAQTIEQARAQGRRLSSEEAGAARSESSLKAGSRAIALYAVAARRPCLLLNADAAEPESYFANQPRGKDALFVDAIITPLVHHAERVAVPVNRDALRDLRGPLTRIARRCGN